jgi:hypothetical protein
MFVGRYIAAREILEVKRGSVAAIDWVADFALAGQAALGEPERASRMVMFRLYYLSASDADRDATNIWHPAANHSPPLWQGTVASRHVPPTQIFLQCRLALDKNNLDPERSEGSLFDLSRLVS